MSVTTIRISKTSLKRWVLHGPIDQALKTTIQADAVRVVPLCTSNGAELEVWVSADDHGECRHHLNIPTMAMIALSETRKKGEAPQISVCEEEDFTAYLQTVVPDDLEPVYGPAVLTGPGGTDIPDLEAETLMEVLLGM